MPKENKTENSARELVQPIIEREGYELVDIEFQKEGRDWILRLFIDHEEGIDLDDCQKVSRLVSDALDEADPISQSYILEVSSPGIERPLKKIEDFERFKGRLALIKLFVPSDGKKEFTGEILGFDGDYVVIKIEGSEKRILFNKIAKANLVFEF